MISGYKFHCYHYGKLWPFVCVDRIGNDALVDIYYKSKTVRVILRKGITRIKKDVTDGQLWRFHRSIYKGNYPKEWGKYAKLPS